MHVSPILYIACVCVLYFIDVRLSLLLLVWMAFHQYKAIRTLSLLAESSYPERSKSIVKNYLFPYINGQV